MNQADFDVRMRRVTEDFDSKRFKQALDGARSLRAELLADPGRDALQLGWARFYEFKCLFELRQFQEGYDLLVSCERGPGALTSKNAAWMFSVGAEMARHLGRPDEVVRLARRCLELRLADSDLPSAAVCCFAACALLRQLGRDELNAPFVRYLIDTGLKHGAANPVAAGIEFAFAALARGDNPELQELLDTSLPKLPPLDTRGTEAAETLPKLIEKIEQASWRSGEGAARKREALERNQRLWQAANDGDLAMVEKLLAAGADPSCTWAKRPGLPTPLLAASFNGHAVVAKRLIDAGAEVHATNVQGRTALVQAADQGHAGIVEALLDAGAFIDHAGVNKHTALHVSSWQNHLAALRVLLHRGAVREVRDINGDTPLSISATENVPDVVRALLDAGADIEAANDFGQTPLMRAAMTGQAPMVELLLSRGANPKTRDRNGLTAQDWALRESHQGIAALLGGN